MKHFIVLISLTAPVEAVEEPLLRQHDAYFQDGYDMGLFLLYGPLVPKGEDPTTARLRSDRAPKGGGMAVARSESFLTLAKFLGQDPLRMKGLASFEVFEFQPVAFPPLLRGWIAPLSYHHPLEAPADDGVFI